MIPTCDVCGDSKIEWVYAGHGNVLELPCSKCEVGMTYAAICYGGPDDGKHLAHWSSRKEYFTPANLNAPDTMTVEVKTVGHYVYVDDYAGLSGGWIWIPEGTNVVPFQPGETISFDYTNYRGEAAQRRATVVTFSYGATKYHPEPQWFCLAHDLDRKELRGFAMAAMTNVKRASRV